MSKSKSSEIWQLFQQHKLSTAAGAFQLTAASKFCTAVTGRYLPPPGPPWRASLTCTSSGGMSIDPKLLVSFTAIVNFNDCVAEHTEMKHHHGGARLDASKQMSKRISH